MKTKKLPSKISNFGSQKSKDTKGFFRILAIGDFHGKFPQKLYNRIKKEDVDLILSPGDFSGNKELHRLFFKYVYGTDKELWEFIGKKKTRELERKNFNSGKEMIKKLASLNKKTYFLFGNNDPVVRKEIGRTRWRDPFNVKFRNMPKKYKNIVNIGCKKTSFRGQKIVGYLTTTYPGRIDNRILKKARKSKDKKLKEKIALIKKDYAHYYKFFKKLVDKDTILLSHNTPYRTKIDKLKQGPQKGKYYGDYLLKNLIKDFKPKLVICGHMHEYQKSIMIGKTLVVATGPAFEGKAAIITLPKKKKGKIRVKFIK